MATTALPFTIKRGVSALLLLGLLSGCAADPSVFPFIRMAPMAPPEPVYEEKPMVDYPTDEIWRPGYWNYDGVDFKWIPGEVVLRPDPTAVWIADRWELRGYGWCFVPGYWQ